MDGVTVPASVFLCSMKRKSISLIAGLMTAALVGVMGMQYYFIRQSYVLQSQLFDESVKAALHIVAQKAEKREALQFINEQEQKDIHRRKVRAEEHHRLTRMEKLREQLNEQEAAFQKQFEEVRGRYPVGMIIANEFFETYVRTPVANNPVRYDFTASAGSLVQDNQLEVYVQYESPYPKKAKDDSVRYFVLDPIRNHTYIITLPPRADKKLYTELKRLEEQQKLEQAALFFDAVTTQAGLIQNLANEFELAKRPLKQRIDSYFIEEELRKELRSREIDAPFNLEVRDGRNRLLYQLSNFETVPANASTYSASLFPNDMNRPPASMSIYFPNKQYMLLGNIQVMLISSASLLIVLIGCFAFTILTILRQKKISEMKTDFINNMTHEFKTPVATIMIASESLKDPEIARSQNRVDRLAGIIYDENVRLGNHIERVLNIARLDKGDLKLEMKEVDINELIPVVVDSMGLQLQKKDSRITQQLNAAYAGVMADELHLSNVLSNLIDNAIKYSKEDEHPDITIGTKNTGKNLVITVSDKGIGMNRDQLSRIFEQFYRIPTGNRHDVKGFGLGLSYVHDIVKRLNGSVKVRSEKDRGTEFEITLPLA